MSSTARLTRASFCASRARSTTFVLGPCCVDRRTDSCRSRPQVRLGDLAELHADVTLARIRAYGFRERANADLELGHYLVKHRLHDRGHARQSRTLQADLQNARSSFRRPFLQAEHYREHACCDLLNAAQTRIVSVARIRLDFRKSVRAFKGIICDDISEFESDHLSHAVRSLPANV
jgi:hypothetical protein